MTQPARQRLFKICINGLKEWKEDPGGTTKLERQHYLATEAFPGASVRVIEIFAEDRKQEADD